jgi:hypothetical protein
VKRIRKREPQSSPRWRRTKPGSGAHRPGRWEKDGLGIADAAEKASMPRSELSDLAEKRPW